MKRHLLITIAVLLWSTTTALAQFNTVTQRQAHRKAVPQDTLPINKPTSPTPSTSITPPTNPTLPTTTYTPSNLTMVSPLRHLVITSPFGYRTDPFTRKRAFHSGIDLRANYEPAYAITYGEVIHVGYDNRSGLFVTIRHGSITLSYCHLSQSLVTKGTHVRPGTPIAITGNSGSRSTGPHLHLTLKDTKKGRAIDPSILLRLINLSSE